MSEGSEPKLNWLAEGRRRRVGVDMVSTVEWVYLPLTPAKSVSRVLFLC